MAEELFDPAQIADVLREQEVIAAELDLAERAADYAKAIAPEDSGDYINAIRVVRNGDVVAVVFDDPAAHIIEYGSIDTPEFAVRARTESYFNGGGA